MRTVCRIAPGVAGHNQRWLTADSYTPLFCCRRLPGFADRHLAVRPRDLGAPGWIRTSGLHLRRVARYPLRYEDLRARWWNRTTRAEATVLQTAPFATRVILAGRTTGFEPANDWLTTSPLMPSGSSSVRNRGFEPRTRCVWGSRSSAELIALVGRQRPACRPWCAQEESNLHFRVRSPVPCPLNDGRVVVAGDRTSGLLRVEQTLC